MEIDSVHLSSAGLPKRPEAFSEKFFNLALRKPSSVFNLPDVDQASVAYKNAAPFPHLVIDNFIADDVADIVGSEMLAFSKPLSVSFNDDVQKNKQISTGDEVPPMTGLLAEKFASPQMLRYLEKVTGLERLIPDPYYNSENGHYHIVGPGGVLGSHLDHSHHHSLGIPHVLNLVIYLTKNWEDNQGGALCLFDAKGKTVQKRVPCHFNRAAIFAASPITFHGVEPISMNATQRRHSLYFAYYSVVADKSKRIEGTPTMYRQDEVENDRIDYGTYFVLPWYQLFKRKNWSHLKLRLRSWAKMFVPPIIPMLAKKIFG